MTEVKLVVGLGNPGKDYALTRHNIGFQVVDLLAEFLKIEVKKRKFSSRFGQGEFSGKRIVLLKPWEFMNRSGQAVVTAVGFYKLPLRDLLVISDDMALEPGRIRLRGEGSAGGHNGLADIIEKLGTVEFSRLRIGIGQHNSEDAADFVLDRPSKTEKTLLDTAIKRGKEAVLCWFEYGIETAMNRFN